MPSVRIPRASEPETSTLLDHVAGWGQRVLPHHWLSSLVYRASRIRQTAFKNRLIAWFVSRYQVDLESALDPEPRNYPTLNAFFTRELREQARPRCEIPNAIVSPTDGTVSAIGDIAGDTLIQAKGHS